MGKRIDLGAMAGRVQKDAAPADPLGPPKAAAPVSEPEEQPREQKPAAQRNKIGFYQDPDDSARMRAAFIHTRADQGTRSLSAFIDQAVMAQVRRLEHQYNDGRPWAGIHAGEIPPGPPVGQ